MNCSEKCFGLSHIFCVDFCPAVLEGKTNSYKGVPIIRVNTENASFSFGVIFFSNNAKPNLKGVRWLRHEYGHTVQLNKLGVVQYFCYVVLPSVVCFNSKEHMPNVSYYSLPWEFEADLYGNVPTREDYSADVFDWYYIYSTLVKFMTA